MTSLGELLEKNGITLADTKPGRYYTTCPRCSKDRRKPGHKAAKCLGVTIERDGAHWGCNHCGWTGPEKGGGERRNNNELVSYDYVDADGALVFQKLRNQPGREPRFWCRRPKPGGGWINNTKGIDNKPLYRWPQIVAAMKEDREIAIVEGERDADNLWRIGIPATCNFDGTTDVIKNPKAKQKWKANYSEALRGARIVVFNDNDMPGYAHADNICKLSLGVAARVRRLDLKIDWSEIPKGGDVSDWLAVGGEHTAEKLRALIEGAPDYVPATAAAGDQPADASNDDAELEKLARLAPLDYERARKAAGERLGVKRLALLDTLVKAKRAELGLDGNDAKQGHAIEFPEPTPWAAPVDGAELLDAIAAAVRSHVVLDEHSRDATALWIVHTYIIKLFSISPKLFIRSATRGCGKSTLLDVLAHLVARAMLAANVTTATVFRIIEKFRPTLLIDEVDAFLKENEELRGILNASHRYDGVVPRLVGDDHEPRNFSVYTAIALAGIGGLHATLLDRSVVVDLQRRKVSEPVASLRIGKTAHLDVLVSKILRWVADNNDRLATAEPTMPPGVINRLADNWHALLVIAEIAGGKWPERGRAALVCQQGFSKEAEAQSLLELLLADIYEIFTAKKVEQISSTLLAELLAAREDRPWIEYGRTEKPITPAKVAYLLRPLHITAERIEIEQLDDDGRMATVRLRGYRREQFAEVFERFSSGERGEGGTEVSKCPKADEMGVSRNSEVSKADPVGTLPKSQKASNGGVSDTWTLLQGGEPLLCAECGRPGGNRLAWGDIETVLHPGCEAPFIDRRMREEGITQ